MRFPLLLTWLWLGGCTSGYIGQQCPATTFDISSEGNGRSCGSPTYFKGTVPPGGACSHTEDCQAICCGCKNGNGVALVARCNDKGKCDTQDEACCAFDQHSDVCRRGPSSKYFKSCSGDSDCDSGLTCIKRYQVTSRDSMIGAVCDDPYQQKICTKRCSADSECSSVDGACTGTDACDGAKNLCYNK